jgi:hypothetical protein
MESAGPDHPACDSVAASWRRPHEQQTNRKPPLNPEIRRNPLRQPLKRILAICALLTCLPTAAADSELLGSWRIARQQPAPWVQNDADVPPALPLGETLVLEPNRVRGPGALACTDVEYSRSEVPIEGLFQGGLRQATADAEKLGVGPDPLRGLSVTCDTGLFEFHLADADSLLFALDNRIYTLSRAPGALAADGSPEAVVQDLLERHFDADMAFTAARWDNKRNALTQRLKAAVDAYFAAAWPEDEPPPINGDPLSDSQEYPTRFAVGAATLAAEQARLTVSFRDARRTTQVHFLLQREDGAWRLDDLEFSSGERLRQLLAVQ